MRAEYEAERARDPKGVQTQIFTNKDIKVIDPKNSQLGNIEDVKHNERKIMTGLRYPRGFFGGEGKDINRAVLEKQEDALVRLLSKANQMLSEGFREMFDTQLLLWSTLPEDIPYSLVWTEKGSGDFKDMAEALSALVEKVGVSPQTAMEEASFDPEVEKKRLEEWAEFQAGLRDRFDARLDEEMESLMTPGDDKPTPIFNSLRLVARQSKTGWRY